MVNLQYWLFHWIDITQLTLSFYVSFTHHFKAYISKVRKNNNVNLDF